MDWFFKKRTGNASKQQSREYKDIDYALARVLLERHMAADQMYCLEITVEHPTSKCGLGVLRRRKQDRKLNPDRQGL
jgi:hypothetical protein